MSLSPNLCSGGHRIRRCCQVTSHRAGRDQQRLLCDLGITQPGEALGHVSPLFFPSPSSGGLHGGLSQVAQTFSRAGTQGRRGAGWYIASSLDSGSANAPDRSTGQWNRRNKTLDLAGLEEKVPKVHKAVEFCCVYKSSLNSTDSCTD